MHGKGIRVKDKIYHYLNIKDHLVQQIKQVRSYCIKEKRNHMLGVITNSRDWVFTRYDLKAEIEKDSKKYMTELEKVNRENNLSK